MNTVTKKRERTPEQKAKAAERARAKRAAAKAGVNPDAMPAWQTVEVDGQTVKVAKNLSPAEAERKARELLAARAPAADVERAAPQDAPKPPKAKRVAKLEVQAKKDGSVRIFPRQHHIDTINASPEWKQAHPKVWKQIKAGRRIEQKSGVVYWSILLASGADVDAVVALLAS